MLYAYLRKLWQWARHSVWSFPAIVLIIFLLLTALGVSGSSIGYYHRLLHGTDDQNPGLIYGRPKSIRSDEFLIFSPNVALQAQTDYPAFNENVGSGREMVIIPEAPIRDWVGLFRPHTIAYFFLPFANAFAFSWWFGLLALVVASYFFFLRVLNHSKLLSILLSVSFALSPFILWWFQISLLLPLAYFFMAATLAIRILGDEKIKFTKSQRTSDIVHTAALAYVGASLGLLLYAPFLIPTVIVLAFFMTGYLIDGIKSGALKTIKLKKPALLITIAVLVALTAGVAFYFDRQEMIKTIMNSEYPGDRKTASGELPFSPLYRLFDGFLMPLLAKPPTGAFYTNQSEASNFILLLPFLLIPGILLQVYDRIKNKNINWTFLSVQMLSVLFILRITVPFGDSFYELLLLDRVPNNRLMIGVGLLGILQLAYLIKYIQNLRIPNRTQTIFAISFSALVLGWLLVFSKYFFSEYLNLSSTFLTIGLLSVLFTSIIGAFLYGKNALGASLLLILTLISGFRVMPLQKGQSFVEDSLIINKIREVSSPSQSWAVVDNFTFESFPIMAGRKLINGRHPYADLDFWKQVDTEQQLESIYNRQGHVIFVTNTSKPNEFFPAQFANIEGAMELVKGNVFKVKFECGDFVYRNIDFILTTHSLNLECVLPVDKVEYPKVTFYIYRIDKNK